MRNLKTEQIAAANYPYFKYSLEYALDSLERMGAARMEFYACYPIFMWTMQGCLR